MQLPSGPPVSLEQLRQSLCERAYLYDHPADYLAGVELALQALGGPAARVVAVDEAGREEWLRTLEQYRAACGPPVSTRARAFESKLERHLSA